MKKKSELLQALKFTLFSLSAGIIQIALDSLLLYVFKWETWWMHYLPSLVASVLWNFTFNRKYTFKPTNHVMRDMLLVAAYYAVFTPASLMLGNWMEAWGASLGMKELFDTAVTIIMMLVNFVTEFLFQKFVVYREKETAAPVEPGKQED